ncbi:MAG: hypothetical protein ACLFUF_02090 [Opitutales bacterium]
MEKSCNKPKVTQGRPHAAHALIALCCVFAAAFPALRAASNLETNSPFLPPGYNENKEQEVDQPKPEPKRKPLSDKIAFHGVAEFDGKMRFSFYNKEEDKSYWIAKDEKEASISPLAFDPESMTVTVKSGNRTEKIELVEAQHTGPSSADRNSRRQAKQAQKDNGDSNKRRVLRRRVILPRKNDS